SFPITCPARPAEKASPTTMKSDTENSIFTQMDRRTALALLVVMSGCAAGPDDASALTGSSGATSTGGGEVSVGPGGSPNGTGGAANGEPGGSGAAPESDASVPSADGSGSPPITEGGSPASDASSGGGSSVLTNRYDNGRSGANTQETRLTQA